MVFKDKPAALNIKSLVKVIVYRFIWIYRAALEVAGGGVNGIFRFISGIVAKEEGELGFGRHNIHGGYNAALVLKISILSNGLIADARLCVSYILSVGKGDAYAARNNFYIYYLRRCKVLGYRDIPDAVGVCLGGIAFVIKGCDNLQNRGFAVGKRAKLPCREGHVIYAHLLHKPLAVRPVALLYGVG